MDDFKVEEVRQRMGACIKVIGVGGGGGNMINHMINEGISGVDIIAVNTDTQALEASLAPDKIQLGKGLGSGMKPERGRKLALESYEELKSCLEKADIVFIASGFGGGTGTGAAPIVAQAAKEVGALTVAVVTKPFMFEGRKRAKLAEEGLQELKKESDSIVVIPNDKLLSIIDKNLGVKDSFKIVDDVLLRAVGGMSSVVLSYGNNDINLDFADVQTVMSHRGMALLGIGEHEGEDAAVEAMKNAIESPLLDDMSIDGALGVLVHFHIHPNCPLAEISAAMGIVYDNADEDAHVIFGTTTDENIPENKVKITIVATGFESEKDKKESLNTINPINDKVARLKKVSGGYDIQENLLDIPTFMRNQMD